MARLCSDKIHQRSLPTDCRRMTWLLTAVLPIALSVVLAGPTSAAETPSAKATAASRPAGGAKTIHVSKLGDNSDGSSWAKAFQTIQAGLQAVPDDKGGHKVIVRPDTYVEANLYPAHKGAAGAYNVLVGDCDGKLGSGATGWVVIDSGCPDVVVRTDPKGATGNPSFIILPSGPPEKGLKSIDWWGPWKCDPSFSGVIWDRWEFRHLYATGSEGGIGWDMTCQANTEFSAMVDDCVGIGRFSGACVMAHVGRPNEPVLFRRSYFCCMDWWGDAGAAYVRAGHTKMPECPDAVFEDCTLVSPDNALECGYPGFDRYTRVKFTNCRMIVLNYSQPVGTPGTGVIHTPLDGKQLHVDLDGCTLMGYKAFGAGKGEISYTAKNTKAYVQFQQKLPANIERLGLWPTETFRSIAPPERPLGDPTLIKDERTFGELCEVAPIIWQDRSVLLECLRPATGAPEEHALALKDVETGERLAHFAVGYSLASVIVHDRVVHVFAARRGTDGSWNDVTHFWSSDLKKWEQNAAIQQENEHLFNSSVCRVDNGFVMAYETDDSRFTPFSIKFARSKNLRDWTKVPEVVFGKDRYAACPCLRLVDGYFYLMYLEHRTPRWFFETCLARSKDLKDWEMSPTNPLITPEAGEDINTSDPDIVEFQGKTYLYYSIGDQKTWAKAKRAIFPDSMGAFFKSRFQHPQRPPG
ncbi:MAG: hypothetical protein KA354_01275 [Phycisphaerae bacterium]|nr:hypothetical protein [Phycisphaerae bacterium]